MIWKGLWTSGKSENRIIMFMKKMTIMMMLDGGLLKNFDISYFFKKFAIVGTSNFVLIS